MTLKSDAVLLVSSVEAARRCGISTRTLRRLKSGDARFPAPIYLGHKKRPRYRSKDLDAYLKNRDLEKV